MEYDENKIINGNYTAPKYKKVSITLQEKTFENILNETYVNGIKIPLSQIINKKLIDAKKNEELIKYLRTEIHKKDELLQQQTQLIQTLNTAENNTKKKKSYFKRLINAILNLD